uniref:Uncharacterized protein n=1 Tax=Arundo donax TaxID=35708 RepID=A0A0A8ZDZ9_ARUDO
MDDAADQLQHLAAWLCFAKKMAAGGKQAAGQLVWRWMHMDEAKVLLFFFC